MKKFLPLILVFSLVLLCACSNSAAAPNSGQPAVEQTAQPQPEPSPENTAPPRAESTPEPNIELINDPNQPIYSGPGYDYEKVGTVKVAGGYAITEEVTDYEGNLWGCLESGAGWIDLGDARSFDGNIALVTADYARDITSPSQADFVDIIPEYLDESYITYIRIVCSEDVRDVSLDLLNVFVEGYSVADTLHSLPTLSAGEEYIVGVIFVGDFTSFGFRCTDSSGITRQYGLSVSGRNGELILSHYASISDNLRPGPPDAEIPPQPTPEVSTS